MYLWNGCVPMEWVHVYLLNWCEGILPMEGVYLCLIAYGIVVVQDAHEKCISLLLPPT